MFSKAPVKRFNERNKTTPAEATQKNTNIKHSTERLSRSPSQCEPSKPLISAVPCLPNSENRSPRALSTSSRGSSVKSQVTRVSQAASSVRRRNTRPSHNFQKEKYIRMKKELKTKQNGLVDLFQIMWKLREEMRNDGIKDAEIIERLKLIDAECLAEGDDMNYTYPDTHDVVIKPEFISTMDEKLKSYSLTYFDFCQKAVNVNNTLVSIIINIEQDKVKVSDNEVKKMLDNLKKESDSITHSFDKIRKTHSDTMKEILDNFTAVIKEREHLKDTKTGNFKEQLTELEKQKNIIIEKLKKEVLLTKNVQTETEAALESAWQRVKEMETKVLSQEATIKTICSKMQKLEEKVRVRNQHRNTQLTKIMESSKNLRAENSMLAKQRDSLQYRVDDLKNVIKKKEREQQHTVNKLKSEIDHLNTSLSAQNCEKLKLQNELEVARMSKKEAEEKLRDLSERVNNNLQHPESSNEDYVSTQHEEELQQQLKTSQELLQSTLQALETLQAEKTSIEIELKNALMKSGDPREKMAVELMESKKAISDLDKKLKSVTTESEKKAKTITELQRKLQEIEQCPGKSPDRSKLQKMPMMEDVQSELKELNSELEKQMQDLKTELERKEALENEQAKLLKEREDLIKKLKIKERRQAEKIVDLSFVVKEHESAASTIIQDIALNGVEGQNLQKLLEVKQVQIIRLEKLLQKQEEQMDRSSLQRIRHEARIGELEKALQDRQRVVKLPFTCTRSATVK